MTKRKRGAPRKATRKQPVNVRLSAAALAALRATGNVSGEVERLALALPQARVVTERPTCATCPYFWQQYTDGRDGFCRLNPGQTVAYSDGWCGSHPQFPAYLASRADKPPADA